MVTNFILSKSVSFSEKEVLLNILKSSKILLLSMAVLEDSSFTADIIPTASGQYLFPFLAWNVLTSAMTG